jgi:1A family penicillin-binding protein
LSFCVNIYAMKNKFHKSENETSFNEKYMKKTPFKTLKNTILFFLALGVFCLGIGIIWAATLNIPTLQSISERKVLQSTKIYDRTGKIVLYDVNKDVKRTIVPLSEISPFVSKALIAIEDTEFYTHKGVRPLAILRAFIANMFSLGISQGGSTITQQVVKNTLLTGDKTPTRKLKEVILALKLEQKYSKDEILALYLNESPWGGSMYGVEEASQTFYGKSAKDVGLAESAYLAALPKAPSYYSPYGKNKTQLDDRKNLVLKRMLDTGSINKEDYEKAKNEQVNFIPRENNSIKAPHFVDFVKMYLDDKYGEGAFDVGGYVVTTTLDYNLQAKGEEIVKKFALENETKFKASNAGLVAVDAKTGQILTMIGSRDYFDEKIDGKYNIATAKRQPGSTFKPFAYATAFNKGLRPETVIFDLKTQFSTNCAPNDFSDNADCYAPSNFDDKFRGPMTLRSALAESINIPALKVLYLSGIKDTIKTAQSMGITTLTDPNRYGLTLVLGGGEVTPLEMTTAYATFANKGVYNPNTPILEIKDSTGKVLEKFEQKSKEVLPKQTALLISDILNDNNARIPSYGANSVLYFPGHDVAVKTGTTNNYRDVWTIGYTPNTAVGAWAGNNDNTPMEKKVAGLIISPMWNAFMKEVINTTPNESFEEPENNNSYVGAPVLRGKWQGGQSYIIDKISKKLATEFTPEDLKQEIVNNDIHSILYWISKDNFLQRPSNPNSDPQFARWEYGVGLWALQNGQSHISPYNPPTSYDDVHTPNSIPKITIVTPSENNFSSNEKIEITANIMAIFPITKSNVFINNVLVGSLTNNKFSFTPQNVDSISDSNELKVVIYDSVQNSATASYQFSVN